MNWNKNYLIHYSIELKKKKKLKYIDNLIKLYIYLLYEFIYLWIYLFIYEFIYYL